MMAVTEAVISEKLTSAFNPSHLEIVDFSDCGCGLKFDVVVVAEKFEGVPLLKRHRLVNEALSIEIPQIHALTLKTLTASEWEKRQQQQKA